MRYLALIFALVLTAALAAALAAEEPLEFASAEQEARFNALAMELRCTVCQNQSLADSDAPLAQDLREEIHEMMLAGRSDGEIKAFLTERYGDFVLYRPPMQGNTLVLWVVPGVLLLVGALAVFFVVRSYNRRLPARREGESS
jgi:cytochrome c-type biogenesis protein CcmH